MELFTKRSSVTESATMRMMTLAHHKEELGQKVYNFAAGDPVLENHPAIWEGVLRGYGSRRSPYPPVAGLEALKRRFAEWMNLRYQTLYGEHNVLITCGGKFGLYALAQALLEEGDEAIIASPYWVSYPGIIELASGKVVAIKTAGKVTAEELKKAITPRTKVFILNNGTNPTGVLYTKDELKGLLDVAISRSLFVISDEVYSELIFTKEPYISCGSFGEAKESVAVIQSFSKNFAMAGWRVGAVLAGEALINRLAMIQGQSTTGTSIISQYAALGALKEWRAVTDYVRDALSLRRSLFFKTFEGLFQPLTSYPPSAIYAFLPLSVFGSETDSEAFCERVFEAAGVALVPGKAFGAEGFVRFSFSESEEEIVEGLSALRRVI